MYDPKALSSPAQIIAFLKGGARQTSVSFGAPLASNPSTLGILGWGDLLGFSEGCKIGARCGEVCGGKTVGLSARGPRFKPPFCC